MFSQMISKRSACLCLFYTLNRQGPLPIENTDVVPQLHKSPHSVKAIQPMASSSKVPQPHGGHKYHEIYCLRDAVSVQYADRVSKLASRKSNAALGTPAYLATYPEALTTTVEGLSEEEKQGMQKLADEWN